MWNKWHKFKIVCCGVMDGTKDRWPTLNNRFGQQTNNKLLLSATRCIYSCLWRIVNHLLQAIPWQIQPEGRFTKGSFNKKITQIQTLFVLLSLPFPSVLKERRESSFRNNSLLNLFGPSVKQAFVLFLQGWVCVLWCIFLCICIRFLFQVLCKHKWSSEEVDLPRWHLSISLL